MKGTISGGCTGRTCSPWNVLLPQGRLGIHEVKYKDTKIKVEIKKKGMDIVVRRFRAI